jgi:hypothetical protein
MVYNRHQDEGRVEPASNPFEPHVYEALGVHRREVAALDRHRLWGVFADV